VAWAAPYLFGGGITTRSISRRGKARKQRKKPKRKEKKRVQNEGRANSKGFVPSAGNSPPQNRVHDRRGGKKTARTPNFSEDTGKKKKEFLGFLP